MKRLAIFLDGTWNTLDNNTNVWRLKSLTAETASQPVYYSQGVGTQRGESARGGVTGYDDEIIGAYTWFIQNFDDGDEIFIFGFSRGAYTARSLSGLICKCGVLKLGAPLSIEQLYARYRIYGAPTIRSLIAKPLAQDASIEEQWLTRYLRPTKVRFVGVLALERFRLDAARVPVYSRTSHPTQKTIAGRMRVVVRRAATGALAH